MFTDVRASQFIGNCKELKLFLSFQPLMEAHRAASGAAFSGAAEESVSVLSLREMLPFQLGYVQQHIISQAPPDQQDKETDGAELLDALPLITNAVRPRHVKTMEPQHRKPRLISSISKHQIIHFGCLFCLVSHCLPKYSNQWCQKEINAG